MNQAPMLAAEILLNVVTSKFVKFTFPATLTDSFTVDFKFHKISFTGDLLMAKLIQGP